MKIFTAVLLFAVMLGYKIEVDAGSFNLSGHWNPGISFGRRHILHQKYHGRNSQDDDVNSEWPQPGHINHFDVPNSFTENNPNGTDSNDTERPQTHHHGPPHRRARKH